ncbi:MAG: hypothetical protein ACI82F_000635 [Planctomycetota bacterium]|jgi:hypothetical protein
MGSGEIESACGALDAQGGEILGMGTSHGGGFAAVAQEFLATVRRSAPSSRGCMVKECREVEVLTRLEIHARPSSTFAALHTQGVARLQHAYPDEPVSGLDASVELDESPVPDSRTKSMLRVPVRFVGNFNSKLAVEGFDKNPINTNVVPNLSRSCDH